MRVAVSAALPPSRVPPIAPPGDAVEAGRVRRLLLASQACALMVAVVGVLVGPGEGPSDSLRRGARVLVVVRPAQGAAGEPDEFDGWVFDASAEALNTRERPLEG